MDTDRTEEFKQLISELTPQDKLDLIDLGRFLLFIRHHKLDKSPLQSWPAYLCSLARGCRELLRLRIYKHLQR